MSWRVLCPYFPQLKSNFSDATLGRFYIEGCLLAFEFQNGKGRREEGRVGSGNGRNRKPNQTF